MKFAYSMYSIVRMVHQRRQPAEALSEVLALWAEFQRKERSPSTAVLSSVVIAYSMLQMPRLAVRLFHAFPEVPLLRAAYRYAIRSAEEAEDVDSILALLDEMKRVGIEASRAEYESLLTACLKQSDNERAELVLQHLESLGGQPSPRVFRQLAHSAIDQRQLDKAVRCVETLIAQGAMNPSWDALLCQKLLGAAANHNHAGAGLVALRGTRDMDLSLARGSLDALFPVAAQTGHAELADELLTQMVRQEEHIEEQHWSAAAQAYAVSGNAEGCLARIAEMHEAGFTPPDGTIRTCATSLATLTMQSRTEHQISGMHQSFMGWLERALGQDCVVVPTSIINLHLELYALRGWIGNIRETLELLEIYAPDVLDAADGDEGDGGDGGADDEGVEVEDEEEGVEGKEDKEVLRVAESNGSRMDAEVDGTLRADDTHRRRAVDGTRQAPRPSVSASPSTSILNATSYAIILEACAAPRTLNMEFAQDVMRRIRRDGVALNERGYSALVHLLVRCGFLDRALEALRRSAAAKTPCDRLACEELARALARAGQHDAALSVLEVMDAAGHVVTSRLTRYMLRMREGRHTDYNSPPADGFGHHSNHSHHHHNQHHHHPFGAAGGGGGGYARGGGRPGGRGWRGERRTASRPDAVSFSETEAAETAERAFAPPVAGGGVVRVKK